MDEWTTAAGIAATAITLSNVIVWAWGQQWTPQQKAAVGGISALGVFVLGIVMFPQEWSDSGTAFAILFEAVITVLASAGAPVFKEAAARPKPEAAAAQQGQPQGLPQPPAGERTMVEKPGRTWGVWSR
jgi:predicted permease